MLLLSHEMKWQNHNEQTTQSEIYNRNHSNFELDYREKKELNFPLCSPGCSNSADKSCLPKDECQHKSVPAAQGTVHHHSLFLETDRGSNPAQLVGDVLRQIILEGVRVSC